MWGGKEWTRQIGCACAQDAADRLRLRAAGRAAHGARAAARQANHNGTQEPPRCDICLKSPPRECQANHSGTQNKERPAVRDLREISHRGCFLALTTL